MNSELLYDAQVVLSYVSKVDYLVDSVLAAFELKCCQTDLEAERAEMWVHTRTHISPQEKLVFSFYGCYGSEYYIELLPEVFSGYNEADFERVVRNEVDKIANGVPMSTEWH